MQLFQPTRDSDKQPNVSATVRMGTHVVERDKGTGQKTKDYTQWGPTKAAPLKPISRERFLEGSSLGQKPGLHEVRMVQKTRLDPKTPADDESRFRQDVASYLKRRSSARHARRVAAFTGALNSQYGSK